MADVLKVWLDWPAYYQKFKEEHGDPVKYNGRLLFPDGWTYSATDKQGPEWPPPGEESALLRLKTAYWNIRKATVTAEREQLKELVDRLKYLQAKKNVPLQQRASVFDDETNRKVLKRLDVDTGALESGRLAWLEADVKECNKQLEELASAKV